MKSLGLKMFNEQNGLLEWDQDMISNNIISGSEEIIYKRLNDNIFIFYKWTILKGYKQNIYQFITEKWILDEDVNDGGVCYFCEFIFNDFTGGKIKFHHEDHGLCDDCVNLWNTSINMVKKLNEIFIVDDIRTNRITVNVIDNRNIDAVSIYHRIIIPINKFSYKTISKFIIDDDCCNLCYPDLSYEDNDICFDYEAYICSKCLDYSKQLIIDDYPKYMIFYSLILDGILDDIIMIIINHLIQLLIL